MRLACALVVSALVLLDARPLLAQRNEIGGTWIATCTVVSTTGGQGKVPPGAVFRERLVILQHGDEAVLRTSRGVLRGSFRAPSHELPTGQWIFALTIQLQPNLQQKLETTILGGETTPMQGSATSTVYARDGATGQWVPIGGEAITFTAVAAISDS